MKNNIISLLFLIYCSFFSLFSVAQATAPDEDGTPYTTCNADGANASRTSNDLSNPVNVGTIDDRSCYANYKETSLYGTTWGIYNITDGSNNQDAANTLQPRIERSLPVASNTNIGTYVKFTGTFRILEVGDTSGTTNDGTYIAQAKGQHTGGGGSADPAICLYLAKPVFDANGNQIAFDIYAERILVRGGSGSTGREIVFLKRVNKNEVTNFELEVGFREDPNNSNSKIHYCDATIGGEVFSFNIPEPDRATQSKIRYGVYRVKGGRAQIRWANTSHIKSENGVDQKLGNEEPMITLLGEPTATIDQGTSYTDSGAIAIDNYDGDLTEDIVISNPVNVNVPGIYTITYNVTDANGNAATQVTRTVTVSGASTSSTQTSLPGTIEVETGDLSNNQTSSGTRNVIGSGNGGTNNIVDEFRRNNNANGTIINHVSIAAGSYDFTFTYYKISNSNTFQIHSTDVNGGNASLLHSFTLLKNSDTGATTSSYGTQTESVTIPSGVTYITITNNQPAAVDLDKVIVTAAGAKPVITLSGDATVNIIQGNTYTDAGATAVGSDGTTDITANIVTENPVNVNTPGSYTVTYNVSDGGVAADEVTRSVRVFSATTIISAQTGDWNATDTWVGGVVPTSTNEVVLNGHVVTIPSSMGAAAAKSIEATGSGQLILRQNNTLTVVGDITFSRSNDGMIIYAQSGNFSTVTFGGTYTIGKKTTIVKRLSQDKWTLVSSGLKNSKQFKTLDDSRNYTVQVGTKYAFGSYDNTAATGAKYTYVSTDDAGSDNTYGNTNWGSGIGWATKSDEDTATTTDTKHDVVFMGELHDADVSVALANAGFNLVGNPYPAYLYGNSATADATNNVLTANSSILSEATLWFWDSDNEAWITKNQASSAYHINPMQGFFVKTNAGSTTFSFTEAMQTHTSNNNTFLKTSNNRFSIDLSIESQGRRTSTSINYLEHTTSSFDNGYDSSVFGGYSSAFEVYTKQLSGDVNKKLAIQSLPNSEYDSMVVPVGLSVSANSEVTFSAEALNLPKGYKVFIEDRLTNAFTRLDEAGSEYTATLSEATEGRFFIHTKASVLSAESQMLRGVSVFNNGSTLHVVGLAQGAATVNLYNMLGKEVYQHSFVAKSVNNIDLPRLAKGVYIVKLHTTKGSLSKKIILN